MVSPLILVAGIARTDQGLSPSTTFCATFCETPRKVVTVSATAQTITMTVVQAQDPDPTAGNEKHQSLTGQLTREVAETIEAT